MSRAPVSSSLRCDIMIKMLVTSVYLSVCCKSLLGMNISVYLYICKCVCMYLQLYTHTNVIQQLRISTTFHTNWVVLFLFYLSFCILYCSIYLPIICFFLGKKMCFLSVTDFSLWNELLGHAGTSARHRGWRLPKCLLPCWAHVFLIGYPWVPSMSAGCKEPRKMYKEIRWVL